MNGITAARGLLVARFWGHNIRMGILAAQRELILGLGQRMAVPRVSELLLPQRDPAPAKEDEFGFVVLEDGSVGPFYVCLENTLALLQAASAPERLPGMDAVALALEMGQTAVYQQALALGAFNAISQHLMRLAGFDPASQQAEGLNQEVRRVGLVGFFRPLVERYLGQGLEVLVVELRPERIPPELRGHLEVSESPAPLAGCDYVICTASTLINDSLERILRAISRPTLVDLMGPSASGLPDALFAQGVDRVSGLIIDDLPLLRQHIATGESWGKSGRKYQLSSSVYPGFEQLLQRIETQSE